MKVKSMFAGVLFALFVLPLLVFLAACNEEPAQDKVTITSDMIEIVAGSNTKTLTYDGTVQHPVIRVVKKFPSQTVYVENRDYTVEWQDSVDVGTYSYRVVSTRTGRLTGSAECSENQTYMIGPFSLSENAGHALIEADTMTYSFDHVGDYIPEVRIKNVKTGNYLDNNLFNITFANNQAPGTADVTVSAKDADNPNIKNNVLSHFTIRKASLSSATITFGDEATFSTPYTGQAIDENVLKDIVKVTYGFDEFGEPKVLTCPTDYEIVPYEQSDYINVGEDIRFVVRAHSLNPYLEGTVLKTFEITKRSIDEGFSIAFSTDDQSGQSEFYFKNASVAPEIDEVKSDSMTVPAGYYDANFYKLETAVGGDVWTKIIKDDVRDAGNYKVEVQGQGNFAGTVSRTFEVLRKNISGSVLKFSGGADTYEDIFTGDPINPDVKITVDGMPAEMSGDTPNLLNVSYSNNIHAGTATVTVTGIGGFSGSVSKEFTITKVSLEDEKVFVAPIADIKFTGTAKTPEVSVTLTTGLNVYELNSKFEDITFDYGTEIFGEVEVVISSVNNGNFTGQIQTQFNIIKASIEEALVGDILNKNFNYETEITLSADDIDVTYGADNYQLVFGEDFDIEYENNIHAGRATATLVGKRYFENEKVTFFYIDPIEHTVDVDETNITSLIGNPDYTTITVTAEDVVISRDAEQLAYNQTLVVEDGASITIETYIGDSITNNTVVVLPDFLDQSFDPDAINFAVKQKGVVSAQQLQKAMHFANYVELGGNIFSSVELFGESSDDFMINTVEQTTFVSKLNLNGFSLFGSYRTGVSDADYENRNYIVKNNHVEGLSIFLMVENSAYDGTAEHNSYIGSSDSYYGLDLRGGHFVGDAELGIEDMNLAVMFKNVSFRGRYAGVATVPNFQNTFDFETGEGIMFVASFENCTFTATAEMKIEGDDYYGDYGYYGGYGDDEDYDPSEDYEVSYPASAFLGAEAMVEFDGCTFQGATGVYIKAGETGISNSSVKATSRYKIEKLESETDYFGTGSALVVDTFNSLPISVYVNNTTIESLVGYAVQEFVTAGILNENTQIILEEVVLDGGAGQYALENQKLRGEEIGSDVLVAIDVSVVPRDKNILEKALLNDGYATTIVNEVSIFENFTVDPSVETIFADRVVVYTGATLVVTKIYPQVETGLLPCETEPGEVKLAVATSEAVLDAIEDELIDEVLLLEGETYTLNITDSTPTTVVVPSNVTVVLENTTSDVLFVFEGSGSTLILTKAFGDELRFEGDDVFVEQQNVTTAAALKNAVTFAKKITLGANISAADTDFVLDLFENAEENAQINVLIDLAGFDILGTLKLAASAENQSITIKITNSLLDGNDEPTRALVGGENAVRGIEIFAGKAEQESGFVSLNMSVQLENLLVKGTETGLWIDDHFDFDDDYHFYSSVTSINCLFESIDKTKEADPLSTFALAGIYAGGYASMSFTDCDVVGGTAVYVKRGYMNFVGGNFEADCEISVDKVSLDVGYYATGSAVVVDSHNSTRAIVLVLNNVNLTSASRYGVEEFVTEGEIFEGTTIQLRGNINVSAKLASFANESENVFNIYADVYSLPFNQIGFEADISNSNIDEIRLQSDTSLVLEIPKELTEILAGRVVVLSGATLNVFDFFNPQKLYTDGETFAAHGQLVLNTDVVENVFVVVDAIENNINYTKVNLLAGDYDLSSWTISLPETLFVVATTNANISLSKYFANIYSQGGIVCLTTNSQADLVGALANGGYTNIVLDGGNYLNVTVTDIRVATTVVTLTNQATVEVNVSIPEVEFVVLEGTTLILNNYLGNNLTHTNNGGSIHQYGILSANQLENAVTYASEIRLGTNLVESVEFLKHITDDADIFVTIDMFGFSILPNAGSVVTVSENSAQDASAHIVITNSQSETNQSFIGTDTCDYGLEVRGGHYTGVADIEDFNLTIFVEKVELVGKYAGLFVAPDYENTYSQETGLGVKLEIGVANSSVNSTETTMNTDYTPAAAYFAGSAKVSVVSSVFVGGTGIFVAGGELEIVDSEIWATNVETSFVWPTNRETNMGYYGTGSAVVVVSKNLAGKAVVVTLDGITVQSTKGYAVEEYVLQSGTLNENTSIVLKGEITIVQAPKGDILDVSGIVDTTEATLN